MKLPNGYGSVYRLKGSRRNPWIAVKTLGWSEDMKRERYTVGYYPSRTKAMEALMEYNKNPIASRGDITLAALYEEWAKGKYEKVEDKTKKSYTVAWNHLIALGDMRVKDLRLTHMQSLVDNMAESGLGRSSCHKVKTLASQLFKFALADDIISKNYAALVELPPDDTEEREIFTDSEIRKIEKLAETDHEAGTVLILLYTGLRIGELVALTKFGVDLKEQLITGGGKTDAGTNRVIPVHPRILRTIRHWYGQPGEYLISRSGNKLATKTYRNNMYYPALERAGVRRLTPHCARHTFGTLANKAGVDTVALQKIIGHADYSTTANIYTHPEIESLRKAIKMIT